jgi:polyisoprenoid-binding protein YceI
VRVEITMNSVFTEPEKLLKHLKSDDFYDVARFPTASFVSSGVKAGAAPPATHTVSGVLTLRGASRALSFPATIQANAEAVSVKAEFAIKRKDFGIVYPGKPDDLIADDVLIRLDVNAKK